MFGSPTFRWPDRLASVLVLRLILWVFVAAFTHEGILSDPFKVADWMDDHQFYSWEESDRSTMLRYHELPAWNPYWCGGTVGVAAPEDPGLGPDFLLRLIFGVEHGRRLAIMLLVVLGFEGMYRLCRRIDSSAVASAFAAVVYGTCANFVSFIHDGWVNFLGFELIPFILYFLLVGSFGPADETLSAATRAEHVRRARLLGGFCVAWIILSAGTYPTPYAMLAVGYVTIATSIVGFFRGRNEVAEEAPRWRRILGIPWLLPWVGAVALGAVALGLSAGKIIPTLRFLHQFPRVFTPVEAHAATEMFTSYWGRYAAVGVLALIGAVTADVAAGIFCGGAILFFALSMGEFDAAAPFHLLRGLPIFGQLRFPDRFMVGVVLFSAVAASRGITRVEDAVPAAARRVWELLSAWKTRRDSLTEPTPPFPVWIGWMFVALATFVAYTRVARPFAEEIMTGVRIRAGTMYVQEGPRSYDGPFRQSRGNRRDVHMFTPANLGSIYCVAGNPLPESALLRGDLAQEEYPEDPAKATVKRVDWTPNSITLDVDANEPTTIRVNQNWAPEWRTSVGSVRSIEKLLAVDVPAGKNTVRLAYRDYFLDFWLLVSLASLGGVAFVLGRDAVRFARRVYEGWDALPTWPDEPVVAGALPTPVETKNEAALKAPAEDEASEVPPPKSEPPAES